MKWEMVVNPDAIVGEAHASTLVESPGGELLCAWFGGAPEGSPDTAIWMSRRTNSEWSPACVIADEPGVPCFNPVFFRHGTTIWVYFKAGKEVEKWSGFRTRSEDGGFTWSAPEILPAGLFGPIKNKGIRLHNGMIAFPSSAESYRAWTGWVYLLDPDSDAWKVRGPLVHPDNPWGVIQPTLWEVTPGHIRALLRSRKEIGRVCVADSFDSGETWTPARPSSLPNPNSGIDAVKLADGRVVLAYNHTDPSPRLSAATGNVRENTSLLGGRHQIHLAVSEDGGETWSPPWEMEAGGAEFSYPAIIQASDGLVHVTYTWNRKGIRYGAFTPAEISLIRAGTFPRPSR